MCLNAKWQFYSSFVWFVTRKFLAWADLPVWFLSAFYRLDALHHFYHRDSSYIQMSLKHWCISEQMHMFVSSDAWTHLAWQNGLVFPDTYYTYILVHLVLTCTVTASAHPYCTKDHHFASGSKSFYHHTFFLKFLLFKKNISIFDTPQNWCLEVRILNNNPQQIDCSFL